jgi:hypothetical protein
LRIVSAHDDPRDTRPIADSCTVKERIADHNLNLFGFE